MANEVYVVIVQAGNGGIRHVEVLDEVPTNWQDGWVRPNLGRHGPGAVVNCFKGNVNGGDSVGVNPEVVTSPKWNVDTLLRILRDEGAEVGEDNDGQIVLYTGYREGPGGGLVKHD